MTTVAETFGWTPIKSYRLRGTPVDATSRLYGVELEIENCINDYESYLVGGITQHADGSLRNNGMEFVTRPMSLPILETTLRAFFEKNKFNKDNYSERCSVHVHANVQDYTIDNLNALSILYATFERVLFSFIGNDRDKNIFCVPWYDTTITQSVASKKSINDLANMCSKKWQKYTALNLHPMYSQGTVEFRHMEGTEDVERILTWVKLINALMVYAKEHPVQAVAPIINDLNTSSAYYGFCREVFKELSPILESVPLFYEMLEDGVICSKYTMIGN